MSFNPSLNEPTGQTVQVIGFGRRFVAILIDSIVLALIGGCLGFMVSLAGVLLIGGDEEAITGVTLVAQCLGFLVGVAYFVIFWATTGQTLGKMALGIKVISTDGLPVSWGKALLRYLGYLISSLPLSIGFIWVAFDAKRQGWHDKIAGTYVVPKDTHFSSPETVTFVPSDPGSTGMVLAILAGLIPVLVFVAICVIAILLLMGPAIGNVFSNIVENLETPTP